MLFNNEYDLLAFRARYYQGLIDRIVVLAADITFSGEPKKFIDTDFISKEITIEVLKLSTETFTSSDYEKRWPVEYHSRRQLLDHVSNKYPGATILHTDADEFPSRSQIKKILYLKKPKCGTVRLNTHYRRANWTSLGVNNECDAVSFFDSQIWLSGEFYKNHGRYIEADPILGELGSHFSYLGMDASGVNSKMSSFSHLEFDRGENLYEFLIPLSDKYVVDHLGRAREMTFGLLKVDDLAELNDVQTAALEFNPEWFEFRRPPSNLISRIAASIFITTNYQESTQAIDFPKTLIGQLRIITDFMTVRVVRKINLLIGYFRRN